MFWLKRSSAPVIVVDFILVNLSECFRRTSAEKKIFLVHEVNVSLAVNWDIEIYEIYF